MNRLMKKQKISRLNKKQKTRNRVKRNQKKNYKDLRLKMKKFAVQIPVHHRH
jgi:hypothetical protein